MLKNIVIFNDYDYVNGGISQVAITSANALAEAGYAVTFISAVSDARRSTLSGKVKRYCTDQYDILDNPSRWDALRQGIWNRKAMRLVASVLEKMHPAETILHLHSWIKALSPAVGRVVTDSGFPVICTLHDFFTACPNGGFYNYPQNTICRLKPMSMACIGTNCDARNYPQKLWRVARQAVQSQWGHIPSGIEHFISVTRFSEDILRPHLPAGSQFHLLSNPVSYTAPGRPKADLSSGSLLFIGRLSPEKGVRLACEAARAAAAPLTIVGDGPLRSELELAFPEVEFKGWLSQAEVFTQMLRSTALVFPSIWYETQGLVVLEALSAGLPVIVADRCAARDYVDSGNGLIFTAGDAGDLAEKMRWMRANPDSAKKMGEYAYTKYWEAPRLPAEHTEATVRIYNTVLEMHSHQKRS